MANLKTNILWELYQKEMFTDVTLEVGRNRYPCHRSILIANGGYFYDLFMTGFNEARSQDVQIRVPDPVGCFPIILKYLYTGDISSITPSNSFSVMLISWYLRIDHLFKCASDSLSDLLNKSANEDDQYGESEDIIQQILYAPFIPCQSTGLYNFISSHFTDFAKFEQFLYFPEIQIKKCLSNSHLSVFSELSLIQWICKYCDLHNYKHQEYKTLIKWQFLTEDDWNEINHCQFVDNIFKKQTLHHRRFLTQDAPNLVNILLALGSKSYDVVKSLIVRYKFMKVIFFDDVYDLFTNPKKYHLRVKGYQNFDINSNANKGKKDSKDQNVKLGNDYSITISTESEKYLFYFKSFELKFSSKNIQIVGIKAYSMSIDNDDFQEKVLDVQPLPEEGQNVFRSHFNTEFPLTKVELRTVAKDTRAQVIESVKFSGFWFDVNQVSLNA